MYNEKRDDYRCPFCLVVAGIEVGDLLTRQTDIVSKTSDVIAFVSAEGWTRNRGHVIVAPVKHIENIYELDDGMGDHLQRAVRKVAVAMKSAYECDGITILQHNERAGDQSVWHYHSHIIPRYYDDRFRRTRFEVIPPSERQRFAVALRSEPGITFPIAGSPSHC